MAGRFSRYPTSLAARSATFRAPKHKSDLLSPWNFRPHVYFRPPPRTLSTFKKVMEARVDKVSALDGSKAKWIEFKKIDWTDQAGTARTWEAASRKTTGETGVDAVAIAALLRHPSRPPSTIIILQYRPPVDGTCVEFPAGLIDAGETPAQAAVRELREETGYNGKVLDISPTIVCDPGMSTANMQFATLEVTLGENDPEPEQQLDDGEFIQRVVVPIHELHDRLVQLSKEGKKVDARLWHWAAGFQFLKTYNL